MKKKYLTYAFGAFLLFQCTAFAQQPGSLDQTFGTGGKVTYNAEHPSTNGARIKLLPNGKLLSAGYSNIPDSGSDTDLLLMQFNADGSIDTEFGDNGSTLFDKDNRYEEALAICLVGEKSLVAINMFGSGVLEAGFVRFNADGGIDTTFGTNGYAAHSIEGKHLLIADMIALPDGKILAVGDAINASMDPNRHWFVGRYNADMTPDTTFANGLGYWIDPVEGGTHVVTGLAVNNDGKIIVAGQRPQLVWDAFAIMQFNSDGTVDTAFGNEGTTMFNFDTFVDYLHGISLQEDGKIVLGGWTTNLVNIYHGGDFCVARLNTDGSLDATFGTNGKAVYDMGLEPNEFALDVLVRKNGKMVLGGSMVINGQPDMGLLFLNSDGSPDTTFGPDGRVSTNFDNGPEEGFSESIFVLEEQPDGKIIASGKTAISSVAYSTLARYNVEQPTASVQQQELDKSVNVYPNPVNNVLYIKFNLPQEQDAQIKLFSVNGQEIATDYSGAKVSVNNNTIALNNFAALSKGMYLVQVTAGNTTQTFKVVK